MNSIDLYNFLINDEITRHSFLGIFSRDELPKSITKKPCCFVINTDNRNQPGTHWLAFYYDENRNATFFDSFGLHPSIYQLDEYLDKTSNQWIYNKKRIQSILSNQCGDFCLFFLYFKCRDYNLDYIQNFFSSDQNNEKLVYRFLNFIDNKKENK